MPRSELAAVLALTPPDDAWRAELVKRFPSLRPFLHLLTEVIEFDAVEAGDVTLGAVPPAPRAAGRVEAPNRGVDRGAV